MKMMLMWKDISLLCLSLLKEKDIYIDPSILIENSNSRTINTRITDTITAIFEHLDIKDPLISETHKKRLDFAQNGSGIANPLFPPAVNLEHSAISDSTNVNIDLSPTNEEIPEIRSSSETHKKKLDLAQDGSVIVDPSVPPSVNFERSAIFNSMSSNIKSPTENEEIHESRPSSEMHKKRASIVQDGSGIVEPLLPRTVNFEHSDASDSISANIKSFSTSEEIPDITSSMTWHKLFVDNVCQWEGDDLSETEIERIKAFIEAGKKILVLSEEEIERLYNRVKSEDKPPLKPVSSWFPSLGFAEVAVELKEGIFTPVPFVEYEPPTMYVLSGEPDVLVQIQHLSRGLEDVEMAAAALNQDNEYSLLNHQFFQQTDEKIDADKLLKVIEDKLATPGHTDHKQLEWLVKCIKDERPTTADVVRGMLEDLKDMDTPVSPQLKDEVEQLISLWNTDSNVALINFVRERIDTTTRQGWNVGGVIGNYTRYTDNQGNKIPQGVHMMLAAIARFDEKPSSSSTAEEVVKEIQDIADDRRGFRGRSVLTGPFSYQSERTKDFYEEIFEEISAKKQPNDANTPSR